jgi:DnaK suppressor protein
MKKKELEEFKKLLLLERQAVVDHLSQLKGDSAGELEQGLGDPVDIASTEITQTAIQKLGNREKKLLSKIDHALEKFESGEYGVCETCGELIAPARLRAGLLLNTVLIVRLSRSKMNDVMGSSEEDDDAMWSVDDDSDQSV